MFQQTRVHRFKGGDKRSAIRGAGQDHHHDAAAQNADHHFTHACTGDVPQLGGIQHVDDRKGDNGCGVTCQLKRVRNVVGKMGAGPVHSPSHADMLNRKSRGSFRVWPARSSAAVAPSRLPATRPRLLLITPPTVGKLTTAAEVIAQ